MFTVFKSLKKNKKLEMKDFKNALLYSDSFDEKTMFDSEHNIKLNLVSEVVRSERSRRTMKYELNYWEDAHLDLIDLTVLKP